MAKLVDVDALIEKMKSDCPLSWRQCGPMFKEYINRANDASEPLRDRVKELEAFVAKVSQCGNSLEMEGIINEAEALLNGVDHG